MPLSRDRITEIVQSVVKSERAGPAMLSVTFVSNPRIRSLNRRHLRRSGVTDVISFGFRRSGGKTPLLGDIYIAPGVARTSASANGITAREEIVRLIVHGTLHVLGYDHPEGNARTRSAMWKKQERLVRRLADRTT